MTEKNTWVKYMGIMYPLLTWEIYQSNTSANTSVKYVSQIRESNVLTSHVRNKLVTSRLRSKLISHDTNWLLMSRTDFSDVSQMCSFLTWEIYQSNMLVKDVCQIREPNTWDKYVSQIRETNVLTSHLRSSSVKYVSQMNPLLTWEFYYSNTSVKCVSQIHQ